MPPEVQTRRVEFSLIQVLQSRRRCCSQRDEYKQEHRKQSGVTMVAEYLKIDAVSSTWNASFWCVFREALGVSVMIETPTQGLFASQGQSCTPSLKPTDHRCVVAVLADRVDTLMESLRQGRPNQD